MERKNKTLSPEDVCDILVKMAKGRSVLSLSIEYGCHRTTITRRVKTYRDERRLGRKKVKFRRRACTREQLLSIVQFYHDDPFATAYECKARLQLPVTVMTIGRYAKFLGLETGIAPRKFYISPINCEARLHYALLHHLWTVEQWESIVFSDESGLCNGGYYRRHVKRLGRGQRHNPDYADYSLNKTRRRNFHGYITIHGQSELTFYRTMNNRVYQQHIVLPMIEDCMQKFGHEDFKIVHDNASFFTCDATQGFLRRNNLLRFYKRIPAYSPDANIIENMWALLKKRVKDKIFEIGRVPGQEFDELMQGVWAGIPLYFMRKLWDSLPRRMHAIVSTEGRLSRY